MKKLIKTMINNILICTLLFFIIFIISKIIINFNGLEYLQWVYKTIIVIIVTGFFAGIIQKIIQTKDEHLRKTLKTILISIILISLISFKLVAFIYVCIFVPEHIVVKNGQKLVGDVHSFLRVNVDYYEYINPFVRGKKKVLYEYYGKGGYDPIEREEYNAESYKWYDENVIEDSEKSTKIENTIKWYNYK